MSVLWVRRDLRLADHPALTAAASDGPVAGLLVVDPALWDGAGEVRRAWLAASVRALRDATGGALVVRIGEPAAVVAQVARETGARTVHVTAESTPYGRARDARVAAALAEQGAAGTGTDAAPYFRVFNPVSQGKRFDPDGDYVRRWVPELAHGYPLRIVDHDEERREALARYNAAR